MLCMGEPVCDVLYHVDKLVTIKPFFQASGCILMVDILSDMVLRGQAIQVHLEPLDRLQYLMDEVTEWKESTATTFLQRDSTRTLLEVQSHKFQMNIKPVRKPCVSLTVNLFHRSCVQDVSL